MKGTIHFGTIEIRLRPHIALYSFVNLSWTSLPSLPMLPAKPPVLDSLNPPCDGTLGITLETDTGNCIQNDNAKKLQAETHGYVHEVQNKREALTGSNQNVGAEGRQAYQADHQCSFMTRTYFHQLNVRDMLS
jgi:hypothetical protein